DSLADRQAHLPERAVGKADVPAHDELVALAFEHVERADVGFADGGDAPGRLVEEGHERHRASGERDEIQDCVEPPVAAVVDFGLAHRALLELCRAESTSSSGPSSSARARSDPCPALLESRPMGHLFPSPEWAAAYKDAINQNEAYKTAGKDWTHGV